MTAKDDGTGDTYSDYPDESNIEFSKVYTQFIWYISTKIALVLQARCVNEIFLILPPRDFIKPSSWSESSVFAFFGCSNKQKLTYSPTFDRNVVFIMMFLVNNSIFLENVVILILNGVKMTSSSLHVCRSNKMQSQQ